MRLTLSMLVVMGVPAVALAQATAPHRAAVPGLPPIGVPLPSITAPLAPIGSPLSPFGFPTGVDTPFRTDHRPIKPSEHHSRFPSKQLFRSQASFVYVVPTHGWFEYLPAPAPPPGTASYVSPEPVTEEPAAGTLRLELTGAGGGSQVYADGYFVGTLDDVNGELRLPPGRHRIEVRVAGHETLTFEVIIVADRSITYRATLLPALVTPPPEAPATPSTFYFIPGCYIGNVPPKDVKLPANCDLSRLITRTR
jgi:hypothetical protein